MNGFARGLIEAGACGLVITVFVTLIAVAMYVVPRLIDLILDHPWRSLVTALSVYILMILAGRVIGG